MNKKGQIISLVVSLMLAASLCSVASNLASQIKPVATNIEPEAPKEILSEREMLTWKNIKKLSIIPYNNYEHMSFIEIYEYMDVNGERFLITATQQGSVVMTKVNQRLIPAPPIELIIEK